MIEHITNHSEIANNYLVQQYKESLNIVNLANVFATRVQEIEDALQAINQYKWIDRAYGLGLDRLGEIVGEDRNFKEDDQYRLSILARIMTNNGGGTPEDLINAIRFTYTPNKIRYTELYPACCYIFIQGSIAPINSWNLLRSIAPLGVKDFTITFSNDDYPFTFSECSSEGADLRIDVTNNANDEFDVTIIETASSEIFEVEADTILVKKGALGFAEIIINRTNLSLGSDDIYYVEEINPLDMILSYKDFDIMAGSKLAEVLKNG